MVGVVIGHMVQYIVEGLFESLTPTVAIGDDAHEVFGRRVGEEGPPALGARASASGGRSASGRGSESRVIGPVPACSPWPASR